MTRIVTLTLNPAIDTNCAVGRLEARIKLRCSRPAYSPGGGGINVARAIQELGGRVTALWLRGGALGDLLGELLDDEGVPHQPLGIDGVTRMSLTVLDESRGREYRFVLPGPELREEEIRACVEALRGLDPPPAYLVMSGSLPPGVSDGLYARLGREAPAGCRVLVDTSGTPLARALEGPAYLIKPNLRELGELAGRELQEPEEIEDVSRALIRRERAEVVVTTLGSRGAVVVTGEGAVRLQAPEVDARSNVGAGDSTLGGLTLALARGDELVDAVRFGMAAGAAAVLTPGNALCRREDAERLHARIRAVGSS
jgi:6-phosphofructokinase 2